MANKFIKLLATLLLGAAVPLFAQEVAKLTKASEGTLTLEKKSHPLAHALAYETTINDEELIVVVLSGQAVSGEQLKETRESEKDGSDPEFKRPYLKLEFTKAGALKLWSAAAGGTSLGRRGGEATTGELQSQDGRVIGKASQPLETEERFPAEFDVRFDVALLKAGESLPATIIKKPGPAANVKPTVTGVFKGNGKEAKLAYVSALWREPFNNQPGIVLLFTERDHSKDKKADFNAVFGKHGSALKISLHEDGGIFGCQVVHTAHSKQGFTSIGSIKTNDFKFEDGKVDGELKTEGQVDTFGETWEVDIKFVAPLGEIPAEFQAADSKKTASTKPTTAPSETAALQPAADQLNVKDLAVTKDASDVEYKALVEHLLFKSKSNVKAVCAELAASLKTQGWAKDGSDMINATSSILRRKRGDAELTIFVKPENEGSQVQIFTSGLSWDEK